MDARNYIEEIKNAMIAQNIKPEDKGAFIKKYMEDNGLRFLNRAERRAKKRKSH